MIMYTKQFSNAVRQVIKKHKARIHTNTHLVRVGIAVCLLARAKGRLVLIAWGLRNSLT